MEENKIPENPFTFPNTDGTTFCTDGMTLRDYLAAKAMQSILNHKHYDGQQMYELSSTSGLSSYAIMGDEPPKEAYERAKQNQLNQAVYVSELSYFVADAMLKQREL